MPGKVRAARAALASTCRFMRRGWCGPNGQECFKLGHASAKASQLLLVLVRAIHSHARYSLFSVQFRSAALAALYLRAAAFMRAISATPSASDGPDAASMQP